MIRRWMERLRARSDDTAALQARAAKLIAKERWLEAAELWRRIADLSPRDGRAFLKVGECFAHAHRSGEALEAYRRAVHAFLRAGRRAQAAAACRRVVELAPRDEVARALLVTLEQPEPRPNLPLRPSTAAVTPAASESHLRPTTAAAPDDCLDPYLPPSAPTGLPRPTPALPGAVAVATSPEVPEIADEDTLPMRARTAQARTPRAPHVDSELRGPSGDELMPDAVFDSLYSRRDARPPVDDPSLPFELVPSDPTPMHGTPGVS